MANLSSLVHELRERIASSSSMSPNKQNDAALESRFRAVIPSLLNAYVVPSTYAKEREVIAVLKLLAHTVKNFPGVFFNGKASAVLPVVGRILPFFAEPAFRSKHGVILETIGCLLSLLRTGDWDAYRQFFTDTMLLIEDLVYAASLCDETHFTEPNRLLLKCYCDSFSGISNDAIFAGDWPVNGAGILIDLTGKERMLPFATSAIKVLCKCLTEGTLYAEGLLDASCVFSVCNLLCYEDDEMHMACFDFAHHIGAARTSEIVPTEKLIQSMAIILSEDVKGVSVFRNSVYDSSLGGCLQSLHSSCPDNVVKSTAADIVRIFPESMLKTRSLELKAALCNAYVRIAKVCPPQSWKPECLIYVLCSNKSVFHLRDCLRVIILRLCPNTVGRMIMVDNHTCKSTLGDNEQENSKVGGKRPIQEKRIFATKRQKIDDRCKDSGITSREHISTNFQVDLLDVGAGEAGTCTPT